MDILINRILIAAMIFLSLSCQKVTKEDIELRQGIYCKINTKKPFSGLLYSYYEDKTISYKMKFNRGIPEGTAVTFGFEGEIINESDYKPLLNLINTDRLMRINLVEFREGPSKKYFVLMITNDTISKEEIIKIKNEVLVTLYKRNNDLLYNNYVIIFSLGELEAPYYQEEK